MNFPVWSTSTVTDLAAYQRYVRAKCTGHRPPALAVSEIMILMDPCRTTE